MDVAVDVDCRVPTYSAIDRARNASNVNIGEEDAPGRIGRERTDTQWRSNTLPIDYGRAGKPGIAPWDVIESVDRFEYTASIAQPQHARIICSHVDKISNRDAARQLEVAPDERRPLAVWCTPQQRMPADNCKCAAASVRRESPDGHVRDLVTVPIAAACEQTVAPRRQKYSLAFHWSLSLERLPGWPFTHRPRSLRLAVTNEKFSQRWLASAIRWVSPSAVDYRPEALLDEKESLFYLKRIVVRGLILLVCR
jgi:hypothetical protein